MGPLDGQQFVLAGGVAVVYVVVPQTRSRLRNVVAKAVSPPKRALSASIATIFAFDRPTSGA